jgi:hypothetical protein
MKTCGPLYIVLLVASHVSATPAGHMHLAKHAAITTRTLAMDGTTIVEVVKGVIATETDLITVYRTFTVTDTDASISVSNTIH